MMKKSVTAYFILYGFSIVEKTRTDRQSISAHGEAASSQIPGNIDNYVTGVRE
jgi:hypothetical protein